MSKNRFGSCSSSITAHADTFDDDVDIVDIDEVDLSSSDDAASLSSSDEDTDIFSIINDCSNEDDNILARKEKYLKAVRTKRTERHNSDSSENFLLTRGR